MVGGPRWDGRYRGPIQREGPVRVGWGTLVRVMCEVRTRVGDSVRVGAAGGVTGRVEASGGLGVRVGDGVTAGGGNLGADGTRV